MLFADNIVAIECPFLLFLSSLQSMEKENKAKQEVVCYKKKIIDVNDPFGLFLILTLNSP